MTVTINIDNYGLAFSDDDPVGEDPRYLDEFDVVHSEINKIAGNDFHLIEQQCRYILLEKSKDLRVAGYLLLALTYAKEVQGLIEGLYIYTELLGSFGTSLHPTRPAAKASAIKWLNNPKLEAFIHNSKITDLNTLNQVKTLIHQLNEQLTAYYPEMECQFFILNAWLNQQKAASPEPPSLAAKVMSKILSTNAPEQKPTPTFIETQQEFINHSRVLFNYLKKNKRRADAIALTRAVCWSDHFSLPIHEQNKTRIMPLRKEALNEINHLLTLNNQEEALFNCCESAMWDNSGPYLLDLSFYAHQALEQLEDKHAIEQLTLKVKQLILRMPQLPFLHFSDNSPFANEDTKHWLNHLISEPCSGKSAPSVANSNTKTHIEFLAQAELQAGDKDILAQLQVLKHIPALSKQEEIQKTFAIALLLAKKNKDIAITYFQDLLKNIQTYHFDRWQPEQAIYILNAYLRLLRNSQNKADEVNKITRWLGQLDPCACL